MSCDGGLFEIDVMQCDFCECQFEPGVAGLGPNREPRCPQCGTCAAHPVPPEEVGDYVITRGTRFG
jgi:hypothetical protein